MADELISIEFNFQDGSDANPTEQYRKAVKNYSTDGVIRPAGRRNLEIERQKLGITVETAETIEADELRPCRKYTKHLAEYEECFREELEFVGGVLDNRGRKELNDLIKQRSLKAADVEAIERRVMGEIDRQTAPQLPILGEPNQRGL